MPPSLLSRLPNIVMSNTKKRNFPVQGMGCAACVARVEGALKNAKGVCSASVSLASNSALVEYDASVTTPGELRQAVKDAGGQQHAQQLAEEQVEEH